MPVCRLTPTDVRIRDMQILSDGHDIPDTPDNSLKHHWMSAARKFAADFVFKPRPFPSTTSEE
jgi:hypothetical protein